MRDRVVAICAFLGPCLLAVGCNQTAPAPTGPATPAAPSVTVVRPVKKTVSRVVEQPGAVMAYEETRLSVKFPGFVKMIGADRSEVGIGRRSSAYAGGHDRHGEICVTDPTLSSTNGASSMSALPKPGSGVHCVAVAATTSA